jgi:alpha-tubulin suppressor-like RCC1 family protein
MKQIGCTPSLPAAPPPRGGPVRRLTRRLAPVLGPAATSPTAPEPAPALDITAAHTLAFRQVSTGFGHTCGVTTNNLAYCWGFNLFGQLGDGTTTILSATPVAVAGGLRFRQVSAGSDHTCGVTTDSLAYCWGINRSGELGNGTTTNRLKPVRVAGGHLFRGVSGASHHSCAVTTGDRAFCWGQNSLGELGDGTTTNRLTPVAVAPPAP